MAQIPLTADQQLEVEDNVATTEFAQSKRNAALAAVVTTQAAFDVCVDKSKKLFDALALPNVPAGPFTELRQGKYSDGTKQPMLYVDEPLPDPLPDPV